MKHIIIEQEALEQVLNDLYAGGYGLSRAIKVLEKALTASIHAPVAWLYKSDAEFHEANTRLIEAAPDLLSSLNAMLTHMGMDEDEWNKATFDKARAAVAKATGEQHTRKTKNQG
jgi:hypothetical protein